MRNEIDVNNVLKYRSDVTKAELRKRSSRTAKRKKMKDSCNIDDASTNKKKSRINSIRTDVEINVGKDKKKRSGATDIGSKGAKKVKVLNEFFINVRKKKEEIMSSMDGSKVEGMENKRIRKKGKKWRKSRKKDRNQENNSEEKSNDERREKKRKKDSNETNDDETNDDGWIAKKEKKRSTTEAEDIRRYFRTEDEH